MFNKFKKLSHVGGVGSPTSSLSPSSSPSRSPRSASNASSRSNSPHHHAYSHISPSRTHSSAAASSSLRSSFARSSTGSRVVSSSSLKASMLPGPASSGSRRPVSAVANTKNVHNTISSNAAPASRSSKARASSLSRSSKSASSASASSHTYYPTSSCSSIPCRKELDAAYDAVREARADAARYRSMMSELENDVSLLRVQLELYRVDGPPLDWRRRIEQFEQQQERGMSNKERENMRKEREAEREARLEAKKQEILQRSSLSPHSSLRPSSSYDAKYRSDSDDDVDISAKAIRSAAQRASLSPSHAHSSSALPFSSLSVAPSSGSVAPSRGVGSFSGSVSQPGLGLHDRQGAWGTLANQTAEFNVFNASR